MTAPPQLPLGFAADPPRTVSRSWVDRWISPLRYPGGKARMADWLVDAFWSQIGLLDIEVWIEPFAGGAGAALTALELLDVPEAWICETHPALAAFWRVVIDDGQAFAAHIETLTPTVTDFAHARDVVAAALAGDRAEDFELGLSAFIVNRCSRSGIVHPRVGVMGGWAQRGTTTVASRFNGPALAKRIRRVAALGSRLRISEGDGIAWVEELDGSGVEDEVFLFVDPPYLQVGNDLYAAGMDDAGHARLAAALRSCPAPWLLTYDAHPRVPQLYPDARILQFDAPHAAGRPGVGCEYLVVPDHLRLPPGLETRHPMGKGATAWVADRVPAV